MKGLACGLVLTLATTACRAANTSFVAGECDAGSRPIAGSVLESAMLRLRGAGPAEDGKAPMVLLLGDSNAEFSGSSLSVYCRGCTVVNKGAGGTMTTDWTPEKFMSRHSTQRKTHSRKGPLATSRGLLGSPSEADGFLLPSGPSRPPLCDPADLSNKGYCKLWTHHACQAFFGCADGETIDCESVPVMPVPGAGESFFGRAGESHRLAGNSCASM